MDNLLSLVWTLGKHLGDEITIRQLSIEAGIPYTTALRTVSAGKGIFVIKKKGSSKLCSLNIKDSLVLNYLSIAERMQAEKMLAKDSLLRQIKSSLPEGDYTAVLFGSRASGKAREKSDVDICIINSDGKKNANFSKAELLFKVQVNPIFFSRKEFKHMLRQKEHNLVHEIIQNHIILYGENLFWKVVLDGI